MKIEKMIEVLNGVESVWDLVGLDLEWLIRKLKADMEEAKTPGIEDSIYAARAEVQKRRKEFDSFMKKLVEIRKDLSKKGPPR